MKEHRGTYLERGFGRLRYTDAVKVYEVADDQEKAMLGQLLREKRQNLIRQHREVPGDQQDSTR